jgi:hypothetical protein
VSATSRAAFELGLGAPMEDCSVVRYRLPERAVVNHLCDRNENLLVALRRRVFASGTCSEGLIGSFALPAAWYESFCEECA